MANRRNPCFDCEHRGKFCFECPSYDVTLSQRWRAGMWAIHPLDEERLAKREAEREAAWMEIREKMGCR